MHVKLVAAIAAGMWLFSGAALAEKPNSYCSGLQGQKFSVQFLEVTFDAATKYCDKSPDGDAAKFAEKVNKKVGKLCEKFNSKLAKADCATEADPDIDPMDLPEPLPCSSFTGFDAGDFTPNDVFCDGADAP